MGKIPKVIHYIWLGDRELSTVSLMCINSWKRKLPDYEIKKWNEDNLHLDELIKKNKFLKKCYELKLWAFVTDYLRVYILYKYGGIYLDTDVEVIKSFDVFLEEDCFLGYEGYKKSENIGTGIIGARANNAFIKKVLDFYEEDIWNVDYFVNPEIFKNVLKNNLEIKQKITLLGYDVFSPYDPYESDPEKHLVDTKNTICIHWYTADWNMTRRGYVFLHTKNIKCKYKKCLEVIRKNIGYYRRCQKKAN